MLHFAIATPAPAPGLTSRTDCQLSHEIGCHLSDPYMVRLIRLVIWSVIQRRRTIAWREWRQKGRRMQVLAMVLAGGEGKRLNPLTADRAKPAVPFGGTYRLVDFVLSNLANAGMRQIAVLTQYKSHSLDRHISLTWRMSTMLGNYVTPVPAQQRLGPRWYQGSADAIYQSLNLLVDEDPDYVVVFGADNIYRMDVEQMLQAHIDGGLGATVAGIRVPRSSATAFGVIDAEQD